MISFMVVQFQWSLDQSWLNILAEDFKDIKDAESYRSEYLSHNPNISPDNISVIQYRQ